MFVASYNFVYLEDESLDVYSKSYIVYTHKINLWDSVKKCEP